ncbi:uncharacterized protein LOC124921566 [Impatiens glandulifera]|uniref:uncharacterized protein LOC124921566 n=1 Tax=Impatiens glandulifera TaxID=253017 RepID=UPI001FB0B610|nr:uncharacterized protein LOC124921566 [Impatiens glandulifera]
MEGNLCDVNHLDSNARLPPRKRLLAGLKNQNAVANGNLHSSSSSTFCLSGEFDLFINRWMGSRESNVNLSLEEIIEASKLAVKFAETARSTAELKAGLAVKAMDAAREALELSATMAEEVARRDRRVKKIKKTMMMKKKKKMQVQLIRNLGRKGRNTKNSSQQNLNQSSSNSKSNDTRYKRLKVNKQIIPENLDPSDEMKSDDDDDNDDDGSSEETHSVESDEIGGSISIAIDDSGAESSQRKKSGVKRNRVKHKNHQPY